MVVAIIRTRTEFHLFNLSLLLLLLLQVGFFLQVKDVFAVIHNFADWRLGVGRDLHQIERSLLRCSQSLGNGDYTYLFTIGGNQSYLWGGYIVVKTRPFIIFFNGYFSVVNKNSYSHARCDITAQQFGKGFHSHSAQLLSAAAAHSNGAGFALFVSRH